MSIKSKFPKRIVLRNLVGEKLFSIRETDENMNFFCVKDCVKDSQIKF